VSVELRCAKHPKRTYLAKPKAGTCCACEDIFHLIEERRMLPGCWAFEIVLPSGRKV